MYFLHTPAVPSVVTGKIEHGINPDPFTVIVITG